MPLRRAAGGRGRGRGAGRGAGRGGARGGGARGGTRGARGGRGRGRGAARRGGGSGAAKPMEVDQEQNFIANIGELATPVGKLRGIFTGKCKFDDHYDAQIEDLEHYLSVMAVLEKSGVEVGFLIFLLYPWCVYCRCYV